MTRTPDATCAAALALPGVRASMALGASPATELARLIAEIDADALIDLVGTNAPVGAVLAQRPARSRGTYAARAGANVAPLIEHTLPAPEGADEAALSRHRSMIEAALHDACAAAPWFAEVGRRSAAEIS